jgi:DNA-binding transcriptional LysR family regulator
MLVFARVVQAGTFTGAAQMLGLPKSSVSRKINQLEARLGVRLLQRTTRVVKLTELGAQYYEHCARIVNDAAEAERSISQVMDVPCGRLRISAPLETGAGELGPVITEYLKVYPQVNVELLLSNQSVDLIEGGFDLAIRAGEMADSSLVARLLGSSRMVVVASEAYLQASGEPERPEQLSEHTLVTYDFSGQRFIYRFNGPDKVELQLKGRFVANNMGVVRGAVEAGLGIGIIPQSLCRKSLQEGRLKTILNAWQLPASGLYAVYPSPRHLTPKVRSFIDFISEHMDFSAI